MLVKTKVSHVFTRFIAMGNHGVKFYFSDVVLCCSSHYRSIGSGVFGQASVASMVKTSRLVSSVIPVCSQYHHKPVVCPNNATNTGCLAIVCLTIISCRLMFPNGFGQCSSVTSLQVVKSSFPFRPCFAITRPAQKCLFPNAQ